MSESPPIDPANSPDGGVKAPRRKNHRPQRGSFTVGSCLSQTLTIWLKNFFPFTLLSALILSPYIVWTFYQLMNPEPVPTAEDISMGIWLQNIDGLIANFLGYVVGATVVFGVFQQLRGRHATVGESILRGLKVMPRIIGTVIIIFLILVSITVLMVLVMLGNLELGIVFMLASAILMMVVYAGLAPVVPVCIFEDRGGPWALKRSWFLTRGYKFKVFLFMVVLVILQAMGGGALGGLVAVLYTNDAANAPDDSFAMALTITGLCVQVLFTSLQAVASTVIYHDLRQLKEGIDTEELASIFE